MRVICSPTNRPVISIDDRDLFFGTEKAKYKAIAEDVKARHALGQPILIGTPSVEKSEIVDKLLNDLGIHHEVLNAKNHAKEATIIAQAGQMGAVTIATNMAGRGTDIKLGKGVKELGGLAVISTERNESRRIDNQLIGRAGRQGDPGYSRCYISMEDELIIRFAPKSYKNMYEKLGDEAFQSRMMSSVFTSAQKRIEGRNFDTRKQLLNYDDVLSRQRKIMYDKRDHILFSDSVSDTIPSYYDLASNYFVKQAIVTRDQEEVVDGNKLQEVVCNEFQIDKKVVPADAFDGLPFEDASVILSARLQKVYANNSKDWPLRWKDYVEKTITLDCIDRRWTKHIDSMSKLREAIWLRSFAQTDPLQAYTNEGFEMFDKMNSQISLDVCKQLLHVQVNAEAAKKQEEEENKKALKDKELITNVKPDDEEIDRSNPTAKIN